MFKALEATGNFIRAVVSLLILGVVGFSAWTGYRIYYARELAIEDRDRELREKDVELAKHRDAIAALSRDVELKQREIDRLDTINRLLKVEHRLARIEVLEKTRPAEGERVKTRFTFVEIDDHNNMLEKPQEFQIDGDIVHVDSLVVSFDDKYVEEADPLRGTSLCLFRRIYGESQKPEDGFPIDTVGARPAAFSRGSEPSQIEREIFSKIWDYANDPELAAEAGVRTAQGKTGYIQLREGKRYRVQMRSTGDVTIQVEEKSPSPSDASL